MRRCPSCRAVRPGLTCRRCGADLAPLVRVERSAAAEVELAGFALRLGYVEAAEDGARRARSRHRSAAATRVLALARLARGDYLGAVGLWQEVRRLESDGARSHG